LKLSGSRNLLQFAIAVRTEQLLQPPARLDLGNRQVGRRAAAEAETVTEKLTRWCLAPLGPMLEERQRRLDILRAQHDPAPASQHERQLECCQLAQLRQREHGVPDRDLPLVSAQAIEAEEAAAILELLERLHRQVEAQALAPPWWRKHAEPGLLESGRPVAQELDRRL
jgi:hypothetical protein